MSNPSKPTPEQIAKLEAILPDDLRDFLAKRGETLQTMSPDTSWTIARSIVIHSILDDTIAIETRRDLIRYLLAATLHRTLGYNMPRILHDAVEKADLTLEEAILSVSTTGAQQFEKNFRFIRNITEALFNSKEPKSPLSVLVTPPPKE